ncbi:MAG TPA: FtsX-like permease family protein [Ignavibacteriales bacterium]|nr:FtsX-like permease family protein [Ignavibacteriales bacterium]
MILSLAWRNIWRNRRRSLIIISAITAGLLSGLFASALLFGMSDSLVSSTINRDIGHIQIHTAQFENEKLLRDTLPDPQRIMGEVRKQEHLAGAAERIVMEGMASSASSSNGIKIVGINPLQEKSVTDIYKQVISGNYFDNDGTKHINEIVIGQKLAENLGVKVRSKIVLSFQDFQGSIVYGAFRIRGIFRTESSGFDKSTVFVLQKDLLRLLNSGPVSHEIVVKLSSVEYVDSVYSRLKSALPALSVKNWKELSPDLKLMDEVTGLQLNIFLGIILFALAFGITNTMLMSVVERVREFGVLMAIGMKRSRVFFMIILETVFLSLAGGIAGMVLASALIAYFGAAGIDLSMFSQGFAQWNFSPVLKPTLPLFFYFTITLMILASAVLSAVYPAVKAIRLKPASAIRTY